MLFTNEIVFRGHPDKVADQISDAILDECISQDPQSRVAVEVVGGKGVIFITGEITSNAIYNVDDITKRVLNDVGYPTNYTIINNIGKQSNDISIGVDIGGAGDQGVMFGYATPYDEYDNLDYTQYLLQEFSKFYDNIRKTNTNFKPDGKAQITAHYVDGEPTHIETVVVSYQNLETNRKETDQIIMDWFNNNSKLPINEFKINPTGRFYVGGFDGDAGLTGRKIIVDTYHGFARHGGGAFSGKDLTKVDRSASYMARKVAKELSKQLGVRVELQVAYGIGIEYPLSIMVNGTDYTNEYADRFKVTNLLKEFNNLEFEELSRYGHFGGKL